MWIESNGLVNTDKLEALKVVRDTFGYAIVGFKNKQAVYILRHEDLETVLDEFNHIKRCLRAGDNLCCVA